MERIENDKMNAKTVTRKIFCIRSDIYIYEEKIGNNEMNERTIVGKSFISSRYKVMIYWKKGRKDGKLRDKSVKTIAGKNCCEISVHFLVKKNLILLL